MYNISVDSLTEEMCIIANIDYRNINAKKELIDFINNSTMHLYADDAYKEFCPARLKLLLQIKEILIDGKTIINPVLKKLRKKRNASYNNYNTWSFSQLSSSTSKSTNDMLIKFIKENEKFLGGYIDQSGRYAIWRKFE